MKNIEGNSFFNAQPMDWVLGGIISILVYINVSAAWKLLSMADFRGQLETLGRKAETERGEDRSQSEAIRTSPHLIIVFQDVLQLLPST
jgi:hypothetical protein